MDLTDSLDNESSHCANNRPFKLIVSIAVKIIEVLKKIYIHAIWSV